MKNNHGGTEEYLVKIFEQNEKILDLLQQFLESKGMENPFKEVVDETKKSNIEKINGLTAREREIIGLILEGKLNKQIAYDLTIAVSTVEYHRSNIMKKLDVKNIGQMIKMYLQWEDSQ